MTRVVGIACAVATLVGCGATHGTATLWVTRDRGHRVVLVRHVPAGLTAMQALDRVADIGTRYGGRYVERIGGVSGSLAAQHDWFYFINGYEADRSATEYRLHAGDVEWWDFRSWKGQLRAPVVVGAFPEPFVHGWGGKTLPAAVMYDPGLRGVARRLAHVVHASTVVPATASLPGPTNIVVVKRAAPGAHAVGTQPGAAVEFFVSPRIAAALARNVTALRYRYEVAR